MARTKQTARKASSGSLRGKKVLASAGPLKKQLKVHGVKAEPTEEKVGPSGHASGSRPAGKRVKFESVQRRVKAEPVSGHTRGPIRGAAPVADHAKIRRFAKRGVKALREIRKYQQTTELLIPRAAIQRLIREITQNVTKSHDMRYQSAALEALQTAAESRIIELFENGQCASIHAKRVTLMARDINLSKRLMRIEG